MRLDLQNIRPLICVFKCCSRSPAVTKLRWFLRNNQETIVADEFFWNFHKIFSTKHCFEKNDKNDRSPFSFSFSLVLGQSYTFYACTRANHARYSSAHVTFCGNSKHSLFKVILRKKNLTGRKCREYRTTSYIIWNLWKNHNIQNDVSVKRS